MKTLLQKKYGMGRRGMQLFWLTSPFLLLTFLFAYVPLFGWSIAFVNYKPGLGVLKSDFVGFKYFVVPFSNPVLRENILRVLRNTLVMSFLNIGTSIIPMLFAVLLAEIPFERYRKSVQVLTTLPHFISWILVYSAVWSIFSLNDGFINRFLLKWDLIKDPIMFLGTSDHVWITQWAYTTWKNLGWSAIIYISSLTSIPEELYEASSIDGANRYHNIWHITIPSLMPTFFVLLMLSIGNLLNNGMDQYYVFQTAMNKDWIEVLDLYVFNQGIRGNQVAFATAVGMFKSLISLILLFSANHLSKVVRGTSVF